MKLVTEQDVAAPIGQVFDELAGFTLLERAARKLGAEVRRLDEGAAAGTGAAWEMSFEFQGKPRTLDIRVVEFCAPERMCADLASKGFQGLTSCEMQAVTSEVTRVTILLEVTPVTLPARLLLKTATLTKGLIEQKFEETVARLLAEIAQGPTGQ
jgi:hypothetical protein